MPMDCNSLVFFREDFYYRWPSSSAKDGPVLSAVLTMFSPFFRNCFWGLGEKKGLHLEPDIFME